MNRLVCASWAVAAGLAVGAGRAGSADQAMIEVQFLEVPPALARELTDASASTNPAVLGKALAGLPGRRDADVLSSPRMIARLGETAQVRVGTEASYAVDVAKDEASGEWRPVFSNIATGVDMLCCVKEEPIEMERLAIAVELSVVEKIAEQVREVPVPGRKDPLKLTLPTFSTRRLSTTCVLTSGQTALLGGLGASPMKGRTDVTLLALLKATRILSPLQQRMKEAVIGSLEFREASVEDVARYLSAVAGKGAGAAPQFDINVMSKGAKAERPTVTLKLRDVSVLDALGYVARLAGGEVEFGENAAILWIP